MKFSASSRSVCLNHARWSAAPTNVRDPPRRRSRPVPPQPTRGAKHAGAWTQRWRRPTHTRGWRRESRVSAPRTGAPQGVPVLRRQRCTHRLQGYAHALQLRHGTRQNCSQPHHRELCPTSTAFDRRNQARPSYRTAAIYDDPRLMQLLLRLALAVAVSTGLYTAGLCFPPVATPLLLFVPMPGLVLATHAPSRECALWFALTASLTMALLGAPATVGFLLPLGAPTLVLAVGIRSFWSFERLVIAGVGAWAAAVTGLSLLAYGDVTALIAAAREQLLNSYNLALSTSGSIGAPDSTLVAMEAERDVLIDGLLQILPALVILTGALTVITNLVLLRNWMGIARNVNLRLWRAPDVLIWALIVTGFCIFMPVPPVALMARNVFLVLLGCYFCQGLAIVCYYLERFRLSRGIRVSSYALIAVQHVVTAMVLALGVFDLWGNFRRLGTTGPANVPLDTEGE